MSKSGSRIVWQSSLKRMDWRRENVGAIYLVPFRAKSVKTGLFAPLSATDGQKLEQSGLISFWPLSELATNRQRGHFLVGFGTGDKVGHKFF